ncbi:AraC family ligand binding domain-containing protein [Paraburkholderia sp. GAS334]|uniref:AraC family ligand binding domain-containing protein n=1 Tax=Paraburkholderia sp. GAS334 TaxID=3035131 RepID=UPI003D1E6CE6
MPAGTICVINSGHLHGGRPATEAGWDYRMVYMTTTGLIGLLKDDGEDFSGTLYFPETVIDDPQTMKLIREAHVCSESNDATHLEKTSRLATAVLQLVQRREQMSQLRCANAGIGRCLVKRFAGVKDCCTAGSGRFGGAQPTVR